MNKSNKYLGCGVGILMTLIGATIPTYIYLRVKTDTIKLELEKAKTESRYNFQERDLNNNGIPERFYEINGKKYFLSIDGKNLEDALKK